MTETLVKNVLSVRERDLEFIAKFNLKGYYKTLEDTNIEYPCQMRVYRNLNKKQGYYFIHQTFEGQVENNLFFEVNKDFETMSMSNFSLTGNNILSLQTLISCAEENKVTDYHSTIFTQKHHTFWREIVLAKAKNKKGFKK